MGGTRLDDFVAARAPISKQFVITGIMIWLILVIHECAVCKVFLTGCASKAVGVPRLIEGGDLRTLYLSSTTSALRHPGLLGWPCDLISV